MASQSAAQREFEHWESLCRHRFRIPSTQLLMRKLPLKLNPFVLEITYEEELDRAFDQVGEVLEELNAARGSATFIPKAQMVLKLLKDVRGLGIWFKEFDGRFTELYSLRSEIKKAIRDHALRYTHMSFFWDFLLPSERQKFRDRHIELFGFPLPSRPGDAEGEGAEGPKPSAGVTGACPEGTKAERPVQKGGRKGGKRKEKSKQNSSMKKEKKPETESPPSDGPPKQDSCLCDECQNVTWSCFERGEREEAFRRAVHKVATEEEEVTRGGPSFSLFKEVREFEREGEAVWCRFDRRRDEVHKAIPTNSDSLTSVKWEGPGCLSLLDHLEYCLPKSRPSIQATDMIRARYWLAQHDPSFLEEGREAVGALRERTLTLEKLLMSLRWADEMITQRGSWRGNLEMERGKEEGSTCCMENLTGARRIEVVKERGSESSRETDTPDVRCIVEAAVRSCMGEDFDRHYARLRVYIAVAEFFIALEALCRTPEKLLLQYTNFPDLCDRIVSQAEEKVKEAGEDPASLAALCFSPGDFFQLRTMASVEEASTYSSSTDMETEHFLLSRLTEAKLQLLGHDVTKKVARHMKAVLSEREGISCVTKHKVSDGDRDFLSLSCDAHSNSSSASDTLITSNQISNPIPQASPSSPPKAPPPRAPANSERLSVRQSVHQPHTLIGTEKSFSSLLAAKLDQPCPPVEEGGQPEPQSEEEGEGEAVPLPATVVDAQGEAVPLPVTVVDAHGDVVMGGVEEAEEDDGFRVSFFSLSTSEILQHAPTNPEAHSNTTPVNTLPPSSVPPSITLSSPAAFSFHAPDFVLRKTRRRTNKLKPTSTTLPPMQPSTQHKPASFHFPPPPSPSHPHAEGSVLKDYRLGRAKRDPTVPTSSPLAATLPVSVSVGDPEAPPAPPATAAVGSDLEAAFGPGQAMAEALALQ
uniref:Uncharacterized protein n=1 Tax=Chromera velia CCMP2878 TaxID=1169474 RepID=A0A0G4HM62_9ALVE|eukprot:Cvel_29026.t1-p1 / transcript=Cvel_29026.t1 / gene=Cvel_29026 / organism=Chromera_velia_CCMP2878 / gene_product=hypothetical protein / transcript_product=hypothetical protein / location=Cvel_scaffold3910:4423-7414(-) / protein_length=924 / sequence_SO=supercontig / SO=protein_coding / is_pseudo=false